MSWRKNALTGEWIRDDDAISAQAAGRDHTPVSRHDSGVSPHHHDSGEAPGMTDPSSVSSCWDAQLGLVPLGIEYAVVTDPDPEIDADEDDAWTETMLGSLGLLDHRP